MSEKDLYEFLENLATDIVNAVNTKTPLEGWRENRQEKDLERRLGEQIDKIEPPRTDPL